MKTDFAKAIVVIARRILQSAEEGRIYDPLTLQWARFITGSNA